ncbi:MAG: hypothetical protein Q8K60_01525 [Parachlamydiaceae bacterium]|nr:hypothetical protein [Parachlamydiaceae bacterium]
MQNHHYYRKFFSSFFIITTILILSIIDINYLIDPYGIYSTPSERLFALTDHYEESHLRLRKARDIVKQQPNMILAGSSRVRAGLTEEALIDTPVVNAFNLGLPGTTMEELYYYLEHAFYFQPNIKTIILGLDLFQFNLNKKINIEFDHNRLNRSTMTLKDLIDTLFTGHALKGSFIIVKENVFYKTPKEIFEKTKESNFRFDKKEEFFLRFIMNSSEWYKNFEFDPKQIDFYQKLVNSCVEKGIDLRVFISPVSVDYCEAITIRGSWPKFERFKEIVSEIFPVWDFSGYNSITTLALETKSGTFYSDSSHYKPVIGRMIISQLYGKKIGPDDFGVLITPENIVAHNEKIRKDQEVWRALNKPVTEYIESLPTANLKWTDDSLK